MPNFDAVNKLINLVKSIGSIIYWAVGIVVSCAWAYYEIYETKDDLVIEKKERKEQVKTLKQRGDKREARRLDDQKEFKDLGMDLEKRIRDIEIEMAYQKGINKSKK